VSAKSGGVVLPVVALSAVAVAVFGFGPVVDTIGDFFGDLVDGGTEIIGPVGEQVMIASDTKVEAEQCGVREMVTERQCGDLHVLVVDARKMPFIARNTRLAWESGLPAVLTMNRPKQAANRQEACGKFVHQYPPPVGSCDEYPMASTDEGGKGARAEEVPARENLCQGGSYRRQYPKDGDQFLVVIASPELIATEAFAGVDIAKEQGLC
jgi:hypothetical protein